MSNMTREKSYPEQQPMKSSSHANMAGMQTFRWRSANAKSLLTRSVPIAPTGNLEM